MPLAFRQTLFPSFATLDVLPSPSFTPLGLPRFPISRSTVQTWSGCRHAYRVQALRRVSATSCEYVRKQHGRQDYSHTVSSCSLYAANFTSRAAVAGLSERTPNAFMLPCLCLQASCRRRLYICLVFGSGRLDRADRKQFRRRWRNER